MSTQVYFILFCLALFHFAYIAFFFLTSWSFVATLHWASTVAPFLQQCFLTLRLPWWIRRESVCLQCRRLRKLVILITQTTDLSNSMKLSHALWGHPRWVGHGGVVWQMWSTGERNGKPLQYSCLENPMNSMKRQNDRILKEELPRSAGA